MDPSILIVDDEPMTRNLLRLILERAGFNISEAEDGVQALEMVAHQMPDLLLLDVMMPNLDGISVCKMLREQAETADLPIILLSARVSPESVRLGLEAGANRYLGKPIGHEDLIRNIRDLLQGVPTDQPL